MEAFAQRPKGREDTLYVYYDRLAGSGEYNILLLLIRHPGRVFSTSQIYEQVWNDPSLGSENTVAVHIRHLREKIEIDPANPRYIKVVWGLGYKMEKQ